MILKVLPSLESGVTFWIESQPLRPATSFFGLICACQVKTKSLTVTGVPSFHTAFFLIVTVSANFGFVVTFASAAAMSGTIEKSGFSMYSPLNAVPAVHDVQVLLHPSRKPFRHGGSCSAPKTTVPPFFGVTELLAEPPPTNTAAARAARARAAKPNRCIRVPPFECPPIVRTGRRPKVETRRVAQS